MPEDPTVGKAASPSRGEEEKERRELLFRWARFLSMGLLAALVVQFLLGLWTNVDASGTTYPPTLGFHFVFGYLLGILSIAALVVSAMLKELRLILPAVLVLLGVVIAAVAGLAFLKDGQPPSASFAMGVGFLLAFSAASFLHSATLPLRVGGKLPTATTAP